MHFEFLVEGQCELTALSILMSKILGPYQEPQTWKIHKHRGIGKFPEDPSQKPSPRDGSLLHNLSSKLRAYGKENRYDLVVVVLVDLDDRSDCRVFKQELVHQLDFCVDKPNTLFRIHFPFFQNNNSFVKYSQPYNNHLLTNNKSFYISRNIPTLDIH